VTNLGNRLVLPAFARQSLLYFIRYESMKLFSLTTLKNARSLHVRCFLERFSNTQVCAGVFIIEKSEMSLCDQSSIVDCDDLTLALVFEEDAQLSRVLQSDGAHAGDESGPVV